VKKKTEKIPKIKKKVLRPYSFKQDEEEESTDLPVFSENQGPPHKDQIELEDRGIILINHSISNNSMVQATRRLLVLHFNEQFQDDIQIILNSPGGDVDAGWAFIDMMKFVKNKIITIATGEVCSMAFSIFIAGDHRIMSPNASAMMHQFAWYKEGHYSDLVAGRKIEDMEHKKDIQHLITYSKYKTEAAVLKHLLKNYDHWLTPKEMKKHGLCDEIYKPKKKK